MNFKSFLTPDFLLFLFGDKEAYYLVLDEGYHEDILYFHYYLSKTFHKNIYDLEVSSKGFFNSILQFLFKNKNRGYIFSKTNYINKKFDTIFNDKKGYNHLMFGRMLGYPECCIKKFVEENKNSKLDKGDISYPSALRYKKQLKKYNLENIFGIKINTKTKKVVRMDFGFIPCNPQCKNALKIITNYCDIKRKINSLVKNGKRN